jgi:prepilin peptidase CpaA
MAPLSGHIHILSSEQQTRTCMQTLLDAVWVNWPVWLVSVVLVIAAVIDGAILKVPNWLTFPFILSGWAWGLLSAGWAGLGYSLAGTLVGTMLLLLLRNRGGMGAGDVKLLAGVGAWLGTVVTLYAFAATAIVGGVMAIAMIAWQGNWFHHYAMAMQIVEEWQTVRQPSELAAIARQRKPRMLLLPYGIPMAVGSIGYFAMAGLLI